MSDYHHKVSNTATPTGEFPRHVVRLDNLAVANLSAIHEIRRQNLARLVEARYDNKGARLARALDNVPAYVNDRLRPGGRTIGEDAARGIESKVGLISGQLDILNSPLRMDPDRIDRVDEALRSMLDGLSEDEKRDTLDFVNDLVGRRKRRRRQ